MYQEIILDHYRHPHHKGLRDEFDSEVHHVNPTCGDEVTLRVKLSDDPDATDGQVGQVVADVSYECEGCSISQASTSVLADLVIGKPVGEALKTERAFNELLTSRGMVEPDEEVLDDAIAFAGVSKYPARVKCALLSWMAWKDALVQAGARDLQGEESHG
jgi:nitrogen fixation NifU-like protein